jgi:hypothetical protein
MDSKQILLKMTFALFKQKIKPKKRKKKIKKIKKRKQSGQGSRGIGPKTKKNYFFYKMTKKMYFFHIKINKLKNKIVYLFTSVLSHL